MRIMNFDANLKKLFYSPRPRVTLKGLSFDTKFKVLVSPNQRYLEIKNIYHIISFEARVSLMGPLRVKVCKLIQYLETRGYPLRQSSGFWRALFNVTT